MAKRIAYTLRVCLCQSQRDTNIVSLCVYYAHPAARSQRGAGNIKIVLKEQLKYVPIIGWGMRLFEFLFLRRSIEHDKVHIKGSVSTEPIFDMEIIIGALTDVARVGMVLQHTWTA